MSLSLMCNKWLAGGGLRSLCRPLWQKTSSSSSHYPAEREPLYNPHDSGLPDFKIFRTVDPLRRYRTTLPFSDRTVGLVPTMGALHDGHLALIRDAAHENTDVFVSIYVNPTQFAITEDLSSYPRTWDSDLAELYALDHALAMSKAPGRISAVFAPTTTVMYPGLSPTSEPTGDGSFVNITPLNRMLEGASRPIFFRGVATVCMKLFNIVRPDRVYFGQKDFQQTVVIQRMVKDFHIDTEVRVITTIRETDGLAMSSRNVYLGARRRKVANVLYRALMAAQQLYQKDGARSRKDIMAAAEKVFVEEQLVQSRLELADRALFEVDYVSLASVESMEELGKVDDRDGAVMSGAIKMLPVEQPTSQEHGQATVRLIDNRVFPPYQEKGFRRRRGRLEM